MRVPAPRPRWKVSSSRCCRSPRRCARWARGAHRRRRRRDRARRAGRLRSGGDRAVPDRGGDAGVQRSERRRFGGRGRALRGRPVRGVFATELLPELRRLAEEFGPDAAVHPPVEMASPIVASERGIPSVTYGFGQVLPEAMVAASAARVAPLWKSAGLVADPHAGLYLDCYLDPCPPGLRLGAAAPARIVQPIRPEIAGGSTEALPSRHRGAR